MKINSKLIAEEVNRVRKTILNEQDEIPNHTPLNVLKDIKKYCDALLEPNVVAKGFSDKFFEDMNDNEKHDWGIYYDDLKSMVDELGTLVN